MINNRKVSIIFDEDNKPIVLIHDKSFKSDTKEDWDFVEDYLRGYIGDCYEITECSEKIFIDKDFPDEYVNSKSRIALKGKRRKAKANAAQGIPEMIEIAVPNESFWEENKEEKHSVDAEKGWYRYYVRFGLPIYNDITGELERYNIYSATMLIRHSSDGKKYLYDFTAIKKKQAARLSNKYCTVKTHFLFIRVISKAVFVKQKLELNI